MRTFLGIVVILISFFYLTPTGIAIIRKRTNTMAIFVLNLFLGWTIIGWVVALVWAVAQDATKPQTIVQG